ncbi:MAG: creatininase family protein [Candidatus Altiarchaeota archaeon]|nr:creatininase family protein [Candidatus Altiarchaeota archaeon]
MMAYLVAVGSFEQHGPHLPFETDTFIAEAVALEVAKKLGTKLVQTIPVGVSPEHMDFEGTKTLSVSGFKEKIKDIVSEYGNVIFINGHGGNNKTLRETSVKHVNLTTFFKPYDHAGEIETSLIMYLKPGFVKTEQIRKHDFRWPDKDGWKMKDLSISGVLGDPTQASPEKGKKYFKQLVEKSIEKIDEMQT